MRRVLLIGLVALVAAAAPLVAQTDIPDFTTFEDGFQTFTDEFAKSLPMNSTIGLNWSDAYIGQLLPIPSFGVGITTGVTTIPGSVFTDLLDKLEVDPTSGALDSIGGVGLPVPGYAFDARIGGLFLPFDLGVKFGTIPATPLGGVDIEYQNLGFDVRYAILDGGILPKVSVGVGYNRLTGRIATPLGIGDQTITETIGSQTAEATITDPELAFDWAANVVDFRVQASKSFIIVEPHIGIGATVGSAETSAGLESEVTATINGSSVTASEFADLTGLDVSDTGIGVTSTANPFTFRAFGGASLNLAILKLDVGLMYNLTSGALGGTLGARVQL